MYIKFQFWGLTVCIVVNGEKFQSQALTLTLIAECPMSNSSELFSYTTICSSFKWIKLLFFELSCLQTDTQTHRQTDREWRQVLYTCGLNRKYNKITNMSLHPEFPGVFTYYLSPCVCLSSSYVITLIWLEDVRLLLFWCGRMFTILFKCLIDQTYTEIELYTHFLCHLDVKICL